MLASAPSHFEYRQTMRDTFLSPTALSRHDTKRLFAVGQVREPQLEAQLFQEQQMHGDLLRTPSFDGYRNLSLKVPPMCLFCLSPCLVHTRPPKFRGLRTLLMPRKRRPNSPSAVCTVGV